MWFSPFTWPCLLTVPSFKHYNFNFQKGIEKRKEYTLCLILGHLYSNYLWIIYYILFCFLISLFSAIKLSCGDFNLHIIIKVFIIFMPYDICDTLIITRPVTYLDLCWVKFQWRVFLSFKSSIWYITKFSTVELKFLYF